MKTVYVAVKVNGCPGYINAQGSVAVRGWLVSASREVAESVAAMAQRKHPGWTVEVQSIAIPA
jgi:hypothetical protein